MTLRDSLPACALPTCRKRLTPEQIRRGQKLCSTRCATAWRRLIGNWRNSKICAPRQAIEDVYLEWKR